MQRVVDNIAASLESDALSAVLAYGLGVSALVLIVLVLAWIMIRSVNRSSRPCSPPGFLSATGT